MSLIVGPNSLLCVLLFGYWIVLFAHVIFSWIPRPPEPLQPIARLSRALVDPVVAPIRRVLPPVQTGGVALDLSIIVLFFALILVRAAVC